MKNSSDNSRFKTKNGFCTQYALHCGYIDQFEKEGLSLTRWHEGGTVYHVRLHDHNSGKRIFWFCYEKTWDSLTAFRKARTAIKKGLSLDEITKHTERKPNY
jgi:hypothetical protein